MAQVVFYSGPEATVTSCDGSLTLEAVTHEAIARGVAALDCVYGYGFIIADKYTVIHFRREYDADGRDVVRFPGPVLREVYP